MHRTCDNSSQFALDQVPYPVLYCRKIDIPTFRLNPGVITEAVQYCTAASRVSTWCSGNRDLFKIVLFLRGNATF